MRLAIALLLASVTAAAAQRLSPNTGGTPASQMAARASANATQARDTALGAASLLPDDTSPQPSDTQRIIRGQVNGKLNDPLLHYPYGRYGATLGNVDPSSLANPFTRSAPGTVTPQRPFATTSGMQGLQRGR